MPTPLELQGLGRPTKQSPPTLNAILIYKKGTERSKTVPNTLITMFADLAPRAAFGATGCGRPDVATFDAHDGYRASISTGTTTAGKDAVPRLVIRTSHACATLVSLDMDVDGVTRAKFSHSDKERAWVPKPHPPPRATPAPRGGSLLFIRATLPARSYTAPVLRGRRLLYTYHGLRFHAQRLPTSRGRPAASPDAPTTCTRDAHAPAMRLGATSTLADQHGRSHDQGGSVTHGGITPPHVPQATSDA